MKSKWWNKFESRPNASVRVICFPYAGGSASAYGAWPKSLPDWIEILAIQLPGRGPRALENPYTEVQLLVEAIFESTRLLLDKPFALYGHSMGAILSFEFARLLRRRHYPLPLHIIAGAHRAPQLSDPGPYCRHLPDIEFVQQLNEWRSVPDLLENQDLRQMVLPTLRADFAMCETYICSEEEPLDCPITAVGGLLDFDVHRDDLEGWKKQTKGRFTLRMLSGDHFFLETAREELTGIVTKELAMARMCTAAAVQGLS